MSSFLELLLQPLNLHRSKHGVLTVGLCRVTERHRIEGDELSRASHEGVIVSFFDRTILLGFLVNLWDDSPVCVIGGVCRAFFDDAFTVEDIKVAKNVNKRIARERSALLG